MGWDRMGWGGMGWDWTLSLSSSEVIHTRWGGGRQFTCLSAHIQDGSSHLGSQNPETPLQRCPDVCILTSSRACPVDKIYQHKGERQWWVWQERSLSPGPSDILRWHLIKTANHCTAM